MLNQKSRFDELSSTLSEDERKEMLEKINKSRRNDETEYIIQVELEEEERSRLIRSDIAELTLWKRIVLWFRTLLSGKSREKVFLGMKISEIKKSIKRVNPGLTGFETRDLTPQFAKHLFDLFSVIFPLRNFYEVFTGQNHFKEQTFLFLIDKYFPESKQNILDLISPVEMEDLSVSSEGRDGMIKLLNKRFNEYIKSIPFKIFERIDNDIKPLFALKNIVLFHYDEIFKAFDYYLPIEVLDKKYPLFQSTPAILILDLIERLYYSLYFALSYIGEEFVICEDVLFVYALHRRGIKVNEKTKEADNAREEIKDEVSVLKNKFFSLTAEITKFNSRIPVIDIIKYFRKDPYYRLKFYLPSVSIKQVFTVALKKQLFGQLDDKLKVIEERVIERKTNDLFENMPVTSFMYYNEDGAGAFIKYNLPYFQKVRSLTLLKNYIQRVYRLSLQEILELINQTLFTNDKRNQNRLLGFASAIEELEDKIAWFDKSLSPEEDDGKTLMRLKYNIGTDLTHQRLFKNFVSEKDREVQNFIEKGLEYFQGFKNVFDELMGSRSENMQVALKTVYIYKNKQQTLLQLLKFMEEKVNTFLTLMNQIAELEKGR